MSLAYCPTRAIFDVETTRIDNPYNAPISCISIIVGNPPEIYQFEEEDVREAVKILLASPGLVTYNGRKFDVPVMLKYMSRGEGRRLRLKPHFDPLFEIQQQRPGLLVSLDNMCKETLGIAKQDLGDESPINLAKYNIPQLLRYNAYDSYLTYLLWNYMCSFGKLYYKMPTRTEFVPDTISRTSR